MVHRLSTSGLESGFGVFRNIIILCVYQELAQPNINAQLRAEPQAKAAYKETPVIEGAGGDAFLPIQLVAIYPSLSVTTSATLRRIW